MRSTSLPMFFHELRQAARECRWLLTIAPLVTAFTLLVYHGVIPVRFDDRLGFLRNLLNFPWPILAWIVPYLILKTPDLQDPQAHWRTLPATKTQVFGSRLLLATVFTVLIPAVVVAGAELAASSGHAWPQFLLMFVYQWAYLWIGAFAAFALRGHRGVVLVVLMAIAVVIAAIATLRYGHSQRTDQGEFNFGLLRALPYWSLVALGGPLFALWRIRRAGKPANSFVWLAVAGAAIPAIIAIENRLVLHPTIRGERLPTVRAKIASCLRPEKGNESSSRMTLSGARTNYIAYVYANTSLALPPEYAGARFENKEYYANKNHHGTGSWENNRGRGRLADFASNEAPYLAVSSAEWTALKNAGYRRSNLDPMFANLGKTLGLPSDPETLILPDKIEKGQTPWLRPSAEPPRRELDAAFLLPNPYSSEFGYESLRKSPVRIRAEVPLTFDTPAKIICHAPMKEIRKNLGLNHVMLTMDSSRYSVSDDWGDRSSLSLTLNKRVDAGALVDVFHEKADTQYAGLVVNRRLGQVIILGGWGQSWGTMAASRASAFHCGFYFSKEHVGDLPDSWWDEAEFVLLESEPGPQKILPLDIEIKPSTAK